MGFVFSLGWVRNARVRRITLAVLAVLFAILSLWPKLYLATAQLVPSSSGGGLASLLGAASGGGLLTSLLGQEGPSIDVDLAAARSQTVAVDVVSQLRREGLLKVDDVAKAASALRHEADIEAIRGNILQISVKDHRPAFAKALVEAYVASLRRHMTDLGLLQASQKRVVAENRLGEAGLQLSRTETALDRFRETNKLAAPEVQLGPAIALVTSLQANLQAEETSLRSQLEFATNDNIQVQASRARIAALRTQITDAQARAQSSGGGPSLGGMTPQLNEYENLYRAAEFAAAEYEVYKRYMETVAVQELSSSINMDVIEPPYLSPERQLNVKAFGGLILVILIFMLSEFYLTDFKRPAMG